MDRDKEVPGAEFLVKFLGKPGPGDTGRLLCDTVGIKNPGGAPTETVGI